MAKCNNQPQSQGNQLENRGRAFDEGNQTCICVKTQAQSEQGTNVASWLFIEDTGRAGCSLASF